MAVIEGLGPTAPIGRTQQRSPKSPGFRVPADAQTRETAPPAGPDLNLGGLLALQEGETETVQDRAARRHGHNLLAGLTAIQHAQLGAGLARGDIERLAALADGIPPACDPRLRAAVAAIGLRARVELAKLQTG